MIHLITGQPGAGKTLYSLFLVNERATKENRPVYYSGIADLRLPWIELEDATKWYDLPVGAIIVIDECQRVFRPRGTGGQVPEHVARLETHRHRGQDLYLITQHPMLVDSNIRRLVGSHRHVVRTFGMQRATIHEWNEVKEQCDKNRADSVRHELAYPKEAFGWYKSAEVHTHKRRVPMRLWVLMALPVLLVGLGWLTYKSLGRYGGTQAAEPATAQGKVEDKLAGSRGLPERTAAEYFGSRVPRVPGLPHTAPVYDKLTDPVQAPVPVACLATERRCQCYTQQGTRIAVGDSTCRQIIENGGYFADFPVGGMTPGDGGRPAAGGDASASVPAGAAKRAAESPSFGPIRPGEGAWSRGGVPAAGGA